MRTANKQLTLLSEAERFALYESPDFNYEQRLKYLTLTDQELQVALTRPSLSAQIHCVLQIGYFKAVKMFYRLTWTDIATEDCGFIMQQYFSNQSLEQNVISKHEYYTQCRTITEFFGYRLWDKSHQELLYSHASKVLRRDINPKFIAMELLSYLQAQKIIRPGYTTLQTIVSSVINIERKRLAVIMNDLTTEEQELLKTLLVEEDTLSKLAAIKQDAKDFKLHMMIEERKKMETLHPIYQISKRLVPKLQLSQQNMHYYANLINYYTIYDLRKRIKIEQTHLYLLCYAWKRYQQISDNLVGAFCYRFKQIEDKIKESSSAKFSQHVMSQREEIITMRRLAQLYVDDTLPNEISFGIVRQKAFAILSKDELISKVSNLAKKDPKEVDFYWQSIDASKRSIKPHLRHLVAALNFSSIHKENRWLSAIAWIKTNLQSKQLAPKKVDCPDKTIPNKLEQYLTTKNGNKPIRVNLHRYEYWIYRRLSTQLRTGTIYLEDSLQYRSLSQELVSLEETEKIIKQLNIPALAQPITKQLDDLFAELHQTWEAFNKALCEDKLKHIRYDEKDKTLHLQKTKTDDDEQLQHDFYKKLPFCDIIDVLRFVDKHTGFLSEFSHVQPRYAKNPAAKKDYLIATIIAQAMNNGNFNMADISGIPYSELQDTLQSHVRLATLKAANDLMSNGIAMMSIFPFYSFDPEVLYGGVDGQKFEAETPTIKSMYSKKYFRKGKGVVAYTYSANHIPLQTELIGANEHESYFVFDIWHNNTTELSPEIITGDMHCINKANFAIMHWFGAKLYPRFTDVEAQRKHLYCYPERAEYKKYLVPPVGEIDRQLIESEWPNQQRIIATLGLKEITQSTLIRKLCTYKAEHRTRRALFEFDKLIRSIYTLKYFLDPNILRNTHRSQNRVESYHQLRAAIAEAYGRKQLIGKTDIALEVSNQCGRLIANAIIYYNSAILSKLRDKYEAEGNQKALDLLRKISPVAWRHIHFHGYLIFSNEHVIDLDKIVQELILDI